VTLATGKTAVPVLPALLPILDVQLVLIVQELVPSVATNTSWIQVHAQVVPTLNA
jgi:hypothetical protein